MELPLFPLNAVIFPGGVLPLRIFEPRYLEMVKECVRGQSEFVICLIQSGQEVGNASQPCKVGTACQIIDWETLSDGLLGVTAQGRRRVRIINTEILSNQLLQGNVEYLQEDQDQTLPEKFNEWAHLVSLIMNKLGRPFSDLQVRLDSADWVVARHSSEPLARTRSGQVSPETPEQTSSRSQALPDDGAQNVPAGVTWSTGHEAPAFPVQNSAGSHTSPEP